MTYRVAIIGAGGMGRTHARHWRAMPDRVEVVGVLDTHREAAETLGTAFDDYDTLLARAKPDIVDICTATPSHLEYIQKAAASGRAIFVEKPLARTLAECDAAIEATERAGVPCMPGHAVRFFPEYAAAKRLVEAGGVGQPAAIRAARMSRMPGAGRSGSWYGDFHRSGGVLLDLSIHDFDWLRWCFGPVQRVFAKGLSGRAEFAGVMDYALATLRFESGAVAHVTGSWAHPSGFRTTFEIAGDAGLIEHDSARTASLVTALRQSDTTATSESPMAATDDPYYLELAAFVNALQAGSVPPVTLHDAREAARISLAALESIQTGKVVTLA